MATDFKNLLTTLQKGDVEFIVIGGVAMVAHGSASATFDLDVCYSRTPENIERLCQALERQHPQLRGAPEGLPFRFNPPTVKAGLNFILKTDLGDLDLLGEVSGLGFYDAVLRMSQATEVYGMRCQVLSLSALIQSKRAAGRSKDLNALAELEALKELNEHLGNQDVEPRGS